MKSVLTGIMLLVLSLNVQALHIGDVTIKKLRVIGSNVLIETNGTMNIDPNCTNRSNFFLVSLPEGDVGNRYLSVLLSAQAQNKKVNPNCILCSSVFESWLGKITQCGEVSIQ